MIRCLLRAGLLLGLASGAADARSVYVASQGAATLVPLAPGATASGTPIPVSRSPAQVVAGPEGRLYLTHPDAGLVTILDAVSGSVIRTIPVSGQPFGIAVSADGARLFVGDWSGNRVLRLSAETGMLQAAVDVGREPAALILDRRGMLYVADRESRQVSVIETARMERIGRVPVGEAPFALALNASQDRLYVANVRSGDVSVVDTLTGKPASTFHVGGMPYGIAVSSDGARLFVSNQQGGTLVVLNAQDGTIQATVPVGRYPEGVAVAGGTAYVANWFSDSVSVLDLATLTETARIAVPEGPRSLVVGPEANR